MNKTLSKTKARLRNKSLKDRTGKAELRWKFEIESLNRLKEGRITDSNTFQRAAKPFYPDIINTNQKLTLTENDDILSNDSDTAQTLELSFQILPGISILLRKSMIQF